MTDYMKNKEQNNNIDINTSQYIDAVNSTFQPAPKPESTTHWLSTDEIYDAIKKIDPGSQVNRDTIHKALLDAGYRYQTRPGSFGLDFRWMLMIK